jgi:hypothetical protein
MGGVRGFGWHNKGESGGNQELWIAVYGGAGRTRRIIGWQFQGGAGCENVWAAVREGRGGEGYLQGCER